MNFLLITLLITIGFAIDAALMPAWYAYIDKKTAKWKKEIEDKYRRG